MNNFKFIVLLATILGSSSLYAQLVYDVNFAPLNFSANNQTLVSGTLNTAGSVVRYTNVITINNQRIDCKVTNVDGTSTFDQDWRSNPNAAPGNTTDALRVDSMFSPILSNTLPGSSFDIFKKIKFEFEAIVFPNTTPTPVILDRVVLNVYDIDREGTGNVKNSVEITRGNYTSFEAISTAVGYNNTDPDVLNFYHTNPANNTKTTYSGVINNDHRYRFTFANLTSFEIGLGEQRTSGQNSLSTNSTYFLAFSRGTGFNPTVIPANLVVDLNTNVSSINNTVQIDDNNPYNFTLGSRNITISDPDNLNSRMTALEISYIDDSIINKNSEFMMINGANVSIDLASPSGTNFSLNSQSYTLTVSPIVSGIRVFTFTSNNGTDTLSRTQAETLIDALQYKNISITGNEKGRRNFTVIAEGTYVSGGITYPLKSPPAIFIANIFVPLPVNVISFTGKALENANQLNWTVAQEVDFSHYEVLRSDDGREFNAFGTVFATENNMDMKSYSFVDASAKSEVSYYKLKLVDNNGSVAYTSLVVVSRNAIVPTVSNLFPNPATTQVNIEVQGVSVDNFNVSVQDINGKIVYQANQASALSNIYQMDVTNFNRGVYVIRIEDEMGNVSVSRFAVSK